MPVSYIVYGSVGLIVVTILLYMVFRKKDRS